MDKDFEYLNRPDLSPEARKRYADALADTIRNLKGSSLMLIISALKGRSFLEAQNK